MPRYVGGPGYIDFGAEMEGARKRRLEDVYVDLALRGEARSERNERRQVDERIYQRQQAAKTREWQTFRYSTEMDLKVLSGLKGAERKLQIERMQTKAKTIRDPEMQKIYQGMVKGTAADPQQQKLTAFNEAYPKMPVPEPTGNEDFDSIALADQIEYEDKRQAGLAKIKGTEHIPLDEFHRVGADKVYYKDASGRGRVVPVKTFEIEKLIAKNGSTDTVEAALARGAVRSPKKGETLSATGRKQFVYEHTNIKNGKKHLEFEDAGWSAGKGPGSGGSDFPLDKTQKRELNSFFALDSIAEAEDIDDYEGLDKKVLAQIQGLHAQMEETGGDLNQNRAIIANFFEAKYPGLVFNLIDKPKLTKTGFWSSLVGPNVMLDQTGGKYGALAAIQGQRVHGFTADNQPFEAVFSIDGKVYDQDFRHKGIRFVNSEGIADKEAFEAWISENTFEELGGSKAPVDSPLSPEEGQNLTIGEIDAYASQTLVKAWYGLDALTKAVYNAFATIGEKPDLKALQNALITRSNQWNEGNLKDAYDVLVEFGMDATRAYKYVNSLPVPFTKANRTKSSAKSEQAEISAVGAEVGWTNVD